MIFTASQGESDNAISNLLSLSFFLYLHIINYIFFLIKKIKNFSLVIFYKIQYVTICCFCRSLPPWHDKLTFIPPFHGVIALCATMLLVLMLFFQYY